jgi:Integrase zinc binding domain
LCIPKGKTLGGKSLRGLILEQAHKVIGHFGEQRTSDYVRRWYWWPRINGDTEKFCKSCVICQRSKTSNLKLAGKLHPLPIPKCPWESIGMDFVGPFPSAKGYNYLWVVICRLTSCLHLVPVTTSTTVVELAHLFLKEIVCLHGLPKLIISD